VFKLKIKTVRQSHKSLFIKIPDNYGLRIDKIISITIKHLDKLITFIGSIKEYHSSYGINIPEFIVKIFGIKLGDYIEIENIHKVGIIKRPTKIFMKSSIDLLALIPEATRKNKRIYVDIFKRESEEWLRVWARGVKIQLELKKYTKLKCFGNLLGQLQAEGAKFQNNKTPYVYFSNVIIEEHVDFINSLRAIGISNNLFYVQCRFDSRALKQEDIKLITKKFTDKTDIDINKFLTKRKNKGYDFYTYVLSVLLGEILLNSMNKIRKILATTKLEGNLKFLAESFVAKLLNGDGTLVVSEFEKVGKNVHQINLKLTDKNIEYRKDYQKIFQNLGVDSWDDKTESLYLSSKLKNLLYLLKINAFKGTTNWNKLLYAIKILTMAKNSHGKSLIRLMKLNELGSFDIVDLVLNLNCTYDSARQWIWKMNKQGYLEKNNKALSVTARGLKMIQPLRKWNKEIKNLNF